MAPVQDTPRRPRGATDNSYGEQGEADAGVGKYFRGAAHLVTRGVSRFDDAARARLSDALVGTGLRDTRRFNLLYRLTSAKLFGICLRICGERRAAEDVLQEVYLTVWSRAGGYDPARGSAIAWLSTIARNRAIDWRRGHRLPPPAALDEAVLVADADPSASDRLLADEAGRRLAAALDGLEPRAREAIRSAFFDGLSYPELAARADVPLGTMKSWVRRGLIHLREALDDA